MKSFFEMVPFQTGVLLLGPFFGQSLIRTVADKAFTRDCLFSRRLFTALGSQGLFAFGATSRRSLGTGPSLSPLDSQNTTKSRGLATSCACRLLPSRENQVFLRATCENSGDRLRVPFCSNPRPSRYPQRRLDAAPVSSSIAREMRPPLRTGIDAA